MIRSGMDMTSSARSEARSREISDCSLVSLALGNALYSGCFSNSYMGKSLSTGARHFASCATHRLQGRRDLIIRLLKLGLGGVVGHDDGLLRVF